MCCPVYLPFVSKVQVDLEPVSKLIVKMYVGEELIVEAGQCLRACKAEGLDREATLYRLASTVQGVYVPQFYDALDG